MPRSWGHLPVPPGIDLPSLEPLPLGNSCPPRLLMAALSDDLPASCQIGHAAWRKPGDKLGWKGKYLLRQPLSWGIGLGLSRGIQQLARQRSKQLPSTERLHKCRACERAHLSQHHPTHPGNTQAAAAAATAASAPNSQSHVNATSSCLSAPKNRASVTGTFCLAQSPGQGIKKQ